MSWQLLNICTQSLLVSRQTSNRVQEIKRRALVTYTVDHLRHQRMEQRGIQRDCAKHKSGEIYWCLFVKLVGSQKHTARAPALSRLYTYYLLSIQTKLLGVHLWVVSLGCIATPCIVMASIIAYTMNILPLCQSRVPSAPAGVCLDLAWSIFVCWSSACSLAHL